MIAIAPTPFGAGRDFAVILPKNTMFLAEIGRQSTLGSYINRG
jgi:hypothetical protein